MSAHFLVVEPWDPDGEPGDLLSVEHPADCPSEIVDHSPSGPIVALTCAVQYHIDGEGLDYTFAHADDPGAPPGVERVAPGRHEIEAWSWVTPGGPWGPTEYDGGLRLAEPDGAP